MRSSPRAGATAWKSFVPLLEPTLSESPVAAELPADVSLAPASPELPAETARWSGEWLGWGGMNMSVDARLAVEALSADGADIAFARTDDDGTSSERLHARLEGDELRGTFANGTSVAFRMRDADTIEFHLSAANGGWMLVFNHGSTGDGTDPARIRHTWASVPLARFFTSRGWMVVFPQRSGRGKSDGAYAEGMKPSGKGYSTDAKIALAGVDRALEDVDAVTAWALADERVDVERLVLGGQSRGGALAIAYTGSFPGLFAGAINFAGGWLGENAASAARVNRETFERGAASELPSLWLYADADSFYSLAHSRKGFDAFERAGGRGAYHVVPLPDDRDGHRLVHVPEAWGHLVDDYLRTPGPA